MAPKLIPPLLTATLVIALMLVQCTHQNAVSKNDKLTEIVAEAKPKETKEKETTQTFEIPSAQYEYPDDNYYFEPQTKDEPKTGVKGPAKHAEKVGLRKDEVSKSSIDAQEEDDNADAAGGAAEEASPAEENEREENAAADAEQPASEDEKGDDKKNDADEQPSLLESSLDKKKGDESSKADEAANTTNSNPPAKSFMDRRILIALCSAAGAIVLIIIIIVGVKYYRYHKYKSVKQENPS